jgi:methenyltetrahydrofolate cyclohydrolase
MAMTLTDRSVRELLAAFRSPDPTPGGGSASALAGAVGAALLAMVAGLSRLRAATAEDLERLAAAGRLTAQLSEELTALVDRDSQAYEAVMGAYRLPKAHADEARRRSAEIQKAIAEATAAPLDVMRRCADAIEQGAVVAAFGNRHASSDVQVALELLAAGLRGARLNVEINLGSLTDASRAEEIRAEIARLNQEADHGVAAARALTASG